MAAKTALVTGSTSGIGVGIARVLASKGYSIFLNGLGETESIERLRKEIEQQSEASVEHLAGDLSDPTEIESMFKLVDEVCPNGIDVLVNNAGKDSYLQSSPDRKCQLSLILP